ncbi:deoxyribose-phosphate aldolase [Rhodococcus sp. BP-252]|uniref:deoxyribose-phosphate aldolase n=1 Tax=unclassified Rhodococcus (in: high G+C Gram-positive bacteria) TaxID=192944 RepID=UPI00142FE8B9|nr:MULTISPECIES: deoxyribose-phosphate aldolase [unclassified Rhodococcus (in: high G+C Gram-positive bacteria)]MBY6413681.1 deoxyribose-phosphate aldolase [Rhodococcus sp. BP-320]MBY6418332.1 deoxyribose-phosphate aldolase [Rhodococcus sp. BP-321]MBY6422457.1 deoxyribose-phosphate aldolase [Rhodococcus sp. BP-324]MBY6428277.1 deoxyribose-phosphate aldolase [Rhodococcus sp. BP-323]MBY6433454.1 deoxyribose-phosphate aldolase [Rhodococcus sp. BP-322]
MSVTRASLARMIDHTLLKPEATPDDVAALVTEGLELGVLAVCVSPSMLPVRAEGLVVAAVAGFPSGKHHSLVKGSEARLAVDQGATEIDMVIDVGAAVAGDYNAVLSDILTVREAIGPTPVLKVIIESAALSDEAIVETCRAAERAGANFVKTSTGFHPAGGASVEAVRLMAETVGGRLGVKASGGIRTTDAALAMIDAGATRLGLSGTRAVLDGLEA